MATCLLFSSPSVRLVIHTFLFYFSHRCLWQCRLYMSVEGRFVTPLWEHKPAGEL